MLACCYQHLLILQAPSTADQPHTARISVPAHPMQVAEPGSHPVENLVPMVLPEVVLNIFSAT